jgi:hypothetical protein
MDCGKEALHDYIIQSLYLTLLFTFIASVPDVQSGYLRRVEELDPSECDTHSPQLIGEHVWVNRVPSTHELKYSGIYIAFVVQYCLLRNAYIWTPYISV